MRVVNDVSLAEWGSFYGTHPEAPIFQSPEMYAVYKRARGFAPEALFSVEADTIQGSILSVWQAWGSGSLAARFGRSLILGAPVGEIGAVKMLLREHRRLAARRSVFSEIRPYAEDVPLQDAALACGFRWEPHLNVLLDLSRGEADLWSSIGKSRRKNIRRAEESGLSVRSVDSSETVLQLHGLVSETYLRAGLPRPDATLFEAAREVLGSRHRWIAILANENGTPIAARAVLVGNGVLHDWYAGSTDRGRELHANEWLVWEILKRGIEASHHTFDFGGSGAVGREYGPGEFKRRFGGRETCPGRMIAVHRPVAYAIGRAVWKALSRIRRR